jgi:hypothetical protein
MLSGKIVTPSFGALGCIIYGSGRLLDDAVRDTAVDLGPFSPLSPLQVASIRRSLSPSIS